MNLLIKIVRKKFDSVSYIVIIDKKVNRAVLPKYRVIGVLSGSLNEKISYLNLDILSFWISHGAVMTKGVRRILSKSINKVDLDVNRYKKNT